MSRNERRQPRPVPTGDPLAEALASDGVRALAMDIAYRLRTVCAHLPEGELVKLATHMALIQQKYLSAGGRSTIRRPSTTILPNLLA